MKLTIERGPFLAAMAGIQPIVLRRATIPILSNVLVEASGGRLAVTATDLDMHATASVPCETETPGATTISGEKLYSILKALPDGADLSIDSEGVRATLQAGRSRFQLPQLPVGDFPTWPTVAMESAFVIPTGALRRLLEVGGMAAANDDVRYYLQSAYMHPVDGAYRVVSTNGHRLTYCDYRPDEPADFPGMMIAAKTLTAIKRLLSVAKPEDGVEISCTATRITLAIGETTLTSKLLDGQYPDYARVIPAGGGGEAIVDTDLLIGALARVRILTSDASGGARNRMIMTIEDGMVRLRGQSGDGESDEQIETEQSGGPLVRIAMDAAYLAEALTLVRTESLRLQHNKEDGPMIITEVSDSSDWLGVIVPQRG